MNAEDELPGANGKLSNAVAAGGASPIVRVPNAEEWMVKRALDSGAHGIMTPMCHSAVSLHIDSALLCSSFRSRSRVESDSG